MFMHVHASQLNKSETDLPVWLHLSTCVHWVTNGWQASCPAAGDGLGGGGSYRPWLTHHIDPPPSYLVSAKTHSSVLTQVYYASFLHSHTQRGQDKADRRQVESAQMAPKQVFSSKVIRWSPENADQFSLKRLWAFQAKSPELINLLGRKKKQNR